MESYLENVYGAFAYEDLFLIFLATFSGLVIGAEREYHNKSAGLRTLMLVSVSSCIFTILSIKIGGANPDRIAANIITGIGFLGAGAIFKDENKISGLTTACTIWITSALGMCFGSSHIFLGLLGGGIVLLVLWSLSSFERRIDRLNKSYNYKISLEAGPEKIDGLEQQFDRYGLKHYILFRSKTPDLLTIHWHVSGKEKSHREVISLLYADASIRHLEI